MEKIKFKNSDGIEYELVWKKPHHTYNADGLCYSPELDNPKILVDPKLKKRRKSANSSGANDATREDGYVYLIQFGSEYKIGTSNNVERRFRQLKTQMPYDGKIIHTIAAGDPMGIEAYWHKYFDSKRLKGEWFKLTADDVKYFKKRTLM